MAVVDPRMKVVMFRLTEQEYDQIREACHKSGARSLSDFARTAVLSDARSIIAPTGTDKPEVLVDDLRRRMDELETRLREMMPANSSTQAAGR
jgi:uncharacterized protein (DUF1778 family)